MTSPSPSPAPISAYQAQENAARLLRHSYAFDPTHGHSLADLLRTGAPPEPDGFADFWISRYQACVHLDPQSSLRDTGITRGPWQVYDLSLRSTGQTPIQGWALVPTAHPPARAFCVLHGYGGRDGPDLDLPFPDAALFFPCSRGLGRSSLPTVPTDPQKHVLHHIEDRDRYILGGCVEDVWMTVSAILQQFPATAGRIGLLGISFGGGIGTLAAPWDPRIRRAHFNVPTFGNHPLRLTLPNVGSAAAVTRAARQQPRVLETLAYHDAANAARYLQIPFHSACALFDPSVAPPGQFAIHNSIPGPKELFVLTAGHHPYPNQEEEARQLKQNIHKHFSGL